MDELIATTIIAGIVGLILASVAGVARLKGCKPEDGVDFACHCALGSFGVFLLGTVILLQLTTK